MKHVFLLLAVLACAQSPSAVPLDREPDHHLYLENESVRVFKVEVPAHSATLMHQHDRDYVFVTLGDSEVENDRAGEKPVMLKLKDGEARFTKGGFAHLAKNLSDAPFRNVTIELKQPQKPHEKLPFEVVNCGDLKNPGPCSKTSTWFASDTVTGRATSIAPGASTGVHRHDAPHLAIAVTDFDLRDEREGQPARELHAKAGDVRWIPGGFSHALVNIGKAEARVVTLEVREASK